jgi:hypothetical protein
VTFRRQFEITIVTFRRQFELTIVIQIMFGYLTQHLVISEGSI